MPETLIETPNELEQNLKLYSERLTALESVVKQTVDSLQKVVSILDDITTKMSMEKK